MKKINCRLQKKGFTLIELLIVIALLGALAVGLLATIDPFEQLKKGRDTSQRNTVSEFYDANLRYYATKAGFPSGLPSSAPTTLDTLTGSVISSLVVAGELKDKFADLAGTGNLAKIYVMAPDPTHISVCFRPESKSFQVDANTVYSSDGTLLTGTTSGAGACKSLDQKSGTDCFFCIQ